MSINDIWRGSPCLSRRLDQGRNFNFVIASYRFTIRHHKEVVAHRNKLKVKGKGGNTMSTLKHHHIKFKQKPGWGGPAEWEAKLKETEGVSLVRIDPEGRDILVEYEILKCREEDIERYMIEAGFILDDSFKERVRRGWIHFTEENEQAEFKHGGTAPCCDLKEIEKRKIK